MQKLTKPQSTEPSGVLQASAMHKRLGRRSQLDRSQLDEYASRVMALESDGESFVQKMHRLFGEAGGLCAASLEKAHAPCISRSMTWSRASGTDQGPTRV